MNSVQPTYHSRKPRPTIPVLLVVCAQALLCLLFSLSSRADPLDHWVLTSPVPTDADIFGVSYVNGQFLANSDGLLFSGDGMNWAERSLVPTNPAVAYRLTSFAYGAGQYVAVGNLGQILTSSNSVDWVPQWSGVDVPLASVAYGVGRFVAVGCPGTGRSIVDSDDGAHWTVRQLSTESGLAQVIFSQGRFYAVGDSGAILSSANGADWLSITSPVSGNLSGIAASTNGRLVVVAGAGQCLTSTDGQHWATDGVTLQSRFPSVAAGGDRFVIVDGGRTWVSTNGVDWATQAAPRLSAASALAYGAGVFVAVGSLGFAASSTNGLVWTGHSRGPDVLFQQVTAGGGLILARGDASTQVLLKSGNGYNWTDAGIGSYSAPFGMAFANGQFVVFAQDNRNPASIFVLTSADASRWTSNSVPPGVGAYRIIYANGQYLGAGPGALNSSLDGQHWTAQRPLSPNAFSGIANGNGRYVVVDGTGTLFVSTTGTNWTPLSTGTNWLTDVAFGNGLFVGIGNGYLVSPGGWAIVSPGVILTSSDGENWTLQQTPFGPAAGTGLNSIAYGGGWFVIIGDEAILTSPDGIHWTARNSPTKAQLLSVAYADGSFVAVGQYGTTLVSGNVRANLEGATMSANGFSLLATGEPGQVYRVLASTDLTAASWTQIGNVTNQAGQVPFLDPNARQFPRRFYRLVYP